MWYDNAIVELIFLLIRMFSKYSTTINEQDIKRLKEKIFEEEEGNK